MPERERRADDQDTPMGDRIDERLAALDPALGDPPPHAGSDRFRLIQEKAMQTTTAPAERHDRTKRHPLADGARPLRPGRRRLLQLGAAAAVTIAAAGLLVTASETPPAAAAAVQEAAENLGAVETHRATLVQTYPNGEVWTFEGEFAGADGRQVGTTRGPDGTETSRWEIVVIGDSTWMVTDDDVHQETLGPDEQLAPFAEASEAVLTAALEGGDVQEFGSGQVRGLDATRYRIRPDEQGRRALTALAPGALSWFALEDPSAVDSIEVWVADDLVRRIQVTFIGDHFMSSSTAEFYDFGADVTIEPPAST